jgi:excisionase family DNA binding protein
MTSRVVFAQAQNEFLTPQEVAGKLNMSLKWVTKQTQARRMPGQIKIGRLWRYRRTDVEKRLLAGSFLLEK